MRKGLSKAVISLVGATLWFATDLAPVSVAAPTAPGASSQVGDLIDPSRSPSSMSRDELRARIDQTSLGLTAATERFIQLDGNLALATSAADELRTQARQVGEETLQYAVESYERSEVPTGLLTADDITASMRRDTLGNAAISSDTEGFANYRTLLKDLEGEEAALLERQLEAASAQVDVDLLYAQLESELTVFGEMEERRLQTTASATQVSAANRARAQGRKQGYYLDLCPVDGTHYFIDSWGFARSGGRRHQGVDMMSPEGTPLVAPIAGRVEHYNNSLGGLSYRLFGASGIYLYGTHLSAFGKEGQVAAGEVIGYVGETGNAAGTGAHLHFEIHPGGQNSGAINPYPDVAAVCSGEQ